ncbi:peptidoglycan DD-metalloendopeptidase family protein [Patescibacteria group bacterium]|nr:peptidoglycan DD-metalloendopeptidase family protein [Patescibacteria group bacterium]
MPTQAVEADLFSSLASIFTSDQAYAETSFDIIKPFKISDNSQTIALLQANVSSTSFFEDKKDSDNSLNNNIVSGTSLLSATGPMGVSDGKDIPDLSKESTSVYVVRKGDSISQIALMFGVSIDTILWANDMKKGDKINPGDVLLILPYSGLEHIVTKGQTLQSIAKLYKVDVSDIVQNNDINLDSTLAIGDMLIIPNASKSEESGTPVKNLSSSIAKDKKYYESHPLKNLVEYFVNPVPGYRKSQGIHDKNAIDMAIPKGSPVHAAASGTVTLARLAYNGGFGGLVIISHPNGTETLYAHLSKLSVHTGESVSQNQVVGSSGGVPGTPYAGRTTGAHLHFEVHGAQNPGVDGSWKY